MKGENGKSKDDMMVGDMINSRYRLKKHIDKGSFGEVWVAEDTFLNDMAVAIKFYWRTDKDGQEMFTREYKRFQDLHHDNLLTAKYFDFFKTVRSL